MTADNQLPKEFEHPLTWAEFLSYSYSTISYVLLPCDIDEKTRIEILGRIRDSRLQEVEQLEILMGSSISIRTSEIRRLYNEWKFKNKRPK